MDRLRRHERWVSSVLRETSQILHAEALLLATPHKVPCRIPDGIVQHGFARNELTSARIPGVDIGMIRRVADHKIIGAVVTDRTCKLQQLSRASSKNAAHFKRTVMWRE